MDAIAGWTRGEHTADVDGRPTTHPTYTRGSGPAVIVIHEMPGLTEGVLRFAEEVVAAGFTVVLPHLFGEVGRPFTMADVVRTTPRVCVSREFTKLARNETSPVAQWLRSLAREVHADVGGPGVGALGMCFTGGFALAMMVDDTTVAPVLCQPTTPFPVGRARAGDLNLSPADRVAVQRRAAAGCEVLGLRFVEDRAVGTRFDTLTELIGDRFIRVEFAGAQHNTVTEHRQQAGVDRVLEFFTEKLGPPG